jgi:hypothetical protein
VTSALRQAASQPAVIFSISAAASVLAYLGFSASGGYVGFPLDDAWIHQTYARNLALRGEFAFVPGQPSAGSTSPLWTGLLAMGYLAHIDYHVWTYALGVTLLALNAWLVYRLVLRFWPRASAAALAAGLLVTVEWHLAWSAGSGMETLLFSACALVVFVLDWPAHASLIGLFAGLAVLTRPDGLSLAPVLAARAWLSGERSWRAALRALFGFGLLVIPYLVFNARLSGSPWPNTFYAKQAEYAVLRSQPLWSRLAKVGALPFIGALALLVPAIVGAAWRAARSRRWEVWICLGWVLALVGAYALRLPVTYQHGRYEVPVVPVLMAVGAGGLAEAARPGSSRFLARVASRTWLAAVAALAAGFWLQGALAYQADVQIIETEMVASARWISAHTATDALVAAHDIGALGYFGGRPVLDMAGLVSPQVIPFIRDESRLRAWLDASGANYLMTFPGWYPNLTASLEPQRVFVTGGPYSPAAGGENMAIYRWSPGP